MKKSHIILIFLIVIGITALILPYTFFPLINTELIWISPTCMIPEGCRNSDYFTLPNNDLIQNKYDLVITGPSFFPFFLTFKHIDSSREYTINSTINDEENVVTITFRMIPGKYLVYGDLDHFYLQLWEHGIISSDFEDSFYIYNTISVVFFFGSIGFVFLRKKYQIRRMNMRIKMRE
ncbi:MAG: hypothetical protein KGD58_06530 [Candidatus Lokiarchaeota archaeon]|nr:hypothetical protein [Candidatus Lokiarchaeota archaeon]